MHLHMYACFPITFPVKWESCQNLPNPKPLKFRTISEPIVVIHDYLCPQMLRKVGVSLYQRTQYHKQSHVAKSHMYCTVPKAIANISFNTLNTVNLWQLVTSCCNWFEQKFTVSLYMWISYSSTVVFINMKSVILYIICDYNTHCVLCVLLYLSCSLRSQVWNGSCGLYMGQWVVVLWW